MPCFAGKIGPCLGVSPGCPTPSFLSSRDRNQGPLLAKRRTPVPPGLGPASGNRPHFSTKTRDVNPMIPDPTTTKYISKRNQADGIIEKPDVVGAISGRPPPRERTRPAGPQKSARIGRIEVDIDAKKGKSEGSLPALDLDRSRPRSWLPPSNPSTASGLQGPDQRPTVRRAHRATQAGHRPRQATLERIVDSAAATP